MAAAADRLRDLADDAEDRGRLADATRAVVAEARTLDLLLALGVRGPEQLDFAADAAALESAVVAVVAREPRFGYELADELQREKRHKLSDRLRTYADRCRALPGHQANHVSQNKELNHAT